MSKVLVVAAHPDDEVLGAGATIHRLAREGNEIFVCLMSHRSPTRYDDLMEGIRKSHDILGVSDSIVGDYECMMFSTQNHHSMVSMIEGAIRRYSPNVVITHFHNDLHVDHQTTAQCSAEAVRLPQRQIGYDTRIEKFLAMEVPSSTDWNYHGSSRFDPNMYFMVDKADVEAKVEAIKVYDEVVRKSPHPRSTKGIYALATKRGCESGLQYAEAFESRFEVY